MKKQNKNRSLWLAVLLLFVCVALTTTVVTNRLNLFQDTSGDVIDLTPQGSSDKSDGTDGEGDGAGNHSGGDGEQPGSSGGTGAGTGSGGSNVEMTVSDGSNVRWTTGTTVQIFSVNYKDGDAQVTVKSDNGDKLIAPGTEQTYMFKLYNTGDVPVDYSMEIEAYITPEETRIPVTARLRRYDGEWIAGSENSYAEVVELDNSRDSATVRTGAYVNYVLEWVWPFEGDDLYDTMLGMEAVTEEITFTVGIKTVATESIYGGDAGIGVIPPKTGDEAKLALYVGILAGAAVVLLLLLILAVKEKRDTEKSN